MPPPILEPLSDARRVLISVNPTAGRGSSAHKIDRLVDLLREREYEPEVLTDLAEVARAANAYHQDGSLRALVGAGGDGTAAELVNRTDVGVPLVMLPLGTENLLAKYLDQPPAAEEEVCERICRGGLVRLDAGRANGRIFLLMLGCGFDAEVVRRLEDQRSGNISHWSYVKPILGSIRSYQYPPLRLYCGKATGDDEPSEIVRWVFAFNMPRYCGGLAFTPEADPADGRLDVCTFRRGGLFSGLRYFANLLARRHDRLADCQMTRAARLRVESDERVPYQLDGDLGGWLPLDVEVVPERLTLIVSQQWAKSQGFSIEA